MTDNAMGSGDGYLRATIGELHRWSLTHFLTAFDSLAAPSDAAFVVSGVTEWICQVPSKNMIASLGWDWYLPGLQGVPACSNCDIRTNVMLVNCEGQDLGQHLTSENLAEWLKRTGWEHAVQEYIQRSH